MMIDDHDDHDWNWGSWSRCKRDDDDPNHHRSKAEVQSGLSHVLHPPQSNTRPLTHDDYSDCDVDDESDDGGGPGKSDPNRCTKSHTWHFGYMGFWTHTADGVMIKMILLTLRCSEYLHIWEERFVLESEKTIHLWTLVCTEYSFPRSGIWNWRIWSCAVDPVWPLKDSSSSSSSKFSHFFQQKII